MEKATPIKYLYTIDFLRALAALSILVWHYQHFYYLAPGGNDFVRSSQPFYSLLYFFYTYGSNAVQLFWVISGFVFASVYVSNQGVTARSFFTNRFARLYPLHFLTLLLVALLQFFSLRQSGKFLIYPENDVYHFFLHLGFMSHWGFEKGFSFNEPIWSVSVEVFIYFIFYLSLRFLVKKRGWASLLYVVAGLIFVAIKPLRTFSWCAVYFYLGVSVYFLRMRWADGKRYMLTGLLLISVSVTAGLLFQGFAMSEYQFIFLLPSIVMVTVAIDELDQGFFTRRLKRLGDLTYGIYLWHVPVQMIMLLGIRFFNIDRNIVSKNLFFVGFIVIVLTIAQISYRYFEVPMRKRLRGT